MKLIFCWVFFLTFCLHAELEIWKLDSLPVRKWTIVKQVPPHTVYKGDGFFVKLWHANSYHFAQGKNDLFIKGIRLGFFEDIAPLKAVIMDEHGSCHGYATWAYDSIGTDSEKIKRKGLDRLEKLSQNKDLLLVIQLYSRMRKNSLKTGFGLTQDFTGKENIGTKNGKYYLIDLDHICDIEDFKLNHEDWKYWLYYLDNKFALYEE